VTPLPRDLRLIREDVPDGGLARDLHERLEGVLEHPSRPEPGRSPAHVDDADRRRDQFGAVSEPLELVDALHDEVFDTFEVSQSQMRDAEGIHAQCGRCGKAFSPREVKRLSEALDGGGGIVPRDRDAADEVECKPVRPLIADLLRYRLALDRGGLGTVEPCGPQVEGRRRQQGRGACLGSLGDGGEGLLQPSVALLEVDPAQPERPECDAEAQCRRLVDREERRRGWRFAASRSSRGSSRSRWARSKAQSAWHRARLADSPASWSRSPA
jgi:hypothetical protein